MHNVYKMQQPLCKITKFIYESDILKIDDVHSLEIEKGGIYMFSNPEMLNTLFNGEFFQDIAKALQFDASQFWGLIQGVFDNVILPVGYTLLCLYCLLELLDKSTRDLLTVEQFIRTFIKLLVGKLMMDNCMALLEGFSAFANALASGMSENASTTSIVDVTPLMEKNLKFWKDIALWLKLIIPYIGILVAGIMARITIYSRAIEIIARNMMAPIGMADIFSEGIRGSGFRYLKKLLAVNLQGTIIIAILMAMNFFNNSLIIEAFEQQTGETVETGERIVVNEPEEIPGSIAFTSIMTAFATVILMQRSKEIAGDLVGV